MTHHRIADLTIEEFTHLIREVVTETIIEVFSRTDKGLELGENMKEALQYSLAQVKAGGETVPAEKIAAGLGLEW